MARHSGTLLLALALLAPLPLGGADSNLDQLLETACGALDPHVSPETCTYQADAYVPGDAEDTCPAATRIVQVGVSYPGMLAPRDGDEADAYHLDVPAGLVGLPLTAAIVSSPGMEPLSAVGGHRLTVHATTPVGEACGPPLGSAVPGEPFTFVPPLPGLYGLVVTSTDGSLFPAAGTTRSCHLMCLPLVNATGYQFRVDV